MKTEKALPWVNAQLDPDLPRKSRCHLLPSSCDNALFIKREDELSSGVVGSKLRKYASLIPFLKTNRYTDAAIIGGPNSNNLVGLLQLLKENRIQPWVFMRESSDQNKQANRRLIDLLCPPKQQIAIPKAQWVSALSQAQTFAAEKTASRKKTFVVPEGALCQAALPGCLYLAADILENEASTGHFLTDLFIDSGTGISAIGLILGLAILDRRAKSRRIHVTLIAGTAPEFETNLARFRNFLPSEILPSASPLPPIEFHHPPFAKSYGAVTPTIIAACRRIAAEEGILMDPVYSVKHYMTMKAVTAKRSAEQKALFIYNGGSLGIAGFLDALGEAAD